MRRLIIAALLSLPAACAPPGTHYEGFTLVRDAPARPIVQPPPPKPDWLVALEDRCRTEGGSFELCRIAGIKAHDQCDALKTEAYSIMDVLRFGMERTHGTAEQVVLANWAGLNEWRPVVGPYWEPYQNPVSYADRRYILAWAVREADTMSPVQFAKAVYDRCLAAH